MAPNFNRRHRVNFPHVGGAMSRVAMTTRIRPTNMEGVMKELAS